MSPLTAADKRKGSAMMRTCPECGRAVRACNLPRHMRVHTLTPQQRLGPAIDEQQRIVDLYGNGRGLTMDEIAREVMWSPTVVWRVLHTYGAYIQHGGSVARLSIDEQLRTAELYARGMTIERVADVLGRSPETIRRRLIRFGVKLRPRGPRPQPERTHSRHRKTSPKGSGRS